MVIAANCPLKHLCRFDGSGLNSRKYGSYLSVTCLCLMGIGLGFARAGLRKVRCPRKNSRAFIFPRRSLGVHGEFKSYPFCYSPPYIVLVPKQIISCYACSRKGQRNRPRSTGRNRAGENRVRTHARVVAVGPG